MMDHNNQNELTHWGNNNGSHKYIDKKMVNGKWRYFYENGPGSTQTRIKNTMSTPNAAQRKIARNAQYKKNVNSMFKNAKDRGSASSKAYDTNRAARKSKVDKMFAQAKSKGEAASKSYDKMSVLDKTLNHLRVNGNTLLNKGKNYLSKIGATASKTLSDIRKSGSKLVDRGSKFVNSVINKATSTSAYKKASNEMMWAKAKAKGKANSAIYDAKKKASNEMMWAKAKAKGKANSAIYDAKKTAEKAGKRASTIAKSTEIKAKRAINNAITGESDYRTSSKVKNADSRSNQYSNSKVQDNRSKWNANGGPVVSYRTGPNGDMTVNKNYQARNPFSKSRVIDKAGNAENNALKKKAKSYRKQQKKKKNSLSGAVERMMNA